MAQVFIKSPRYVTLLGDDIEHGSMGAAINSDDSITTALATAFATATHMQNPIPGAVTALGSNVFDILLNKLLWEKWCTGKFSPGHFLLTTQTLREICIDKTPTPEQSHESMRKHFKAISTARLMYTLFLGIEAGMVALPSLAIFSSPENNQVIYAISDKILRNAVDFTRMYKGFRRFSKLAKGEWAIITTPKQQEILEQTIFDTESQVKPAFS